MRCLKIIPRLHSTALSLAACLMMIGTGADAQTYGTYGDLSYAEYADHIEITDCDRAASGALSIPSSINGKPVTSIGSGAFSWCPSLTSVTIPNGVTTIGGAAFDYCTSLTSVTIPDGVTTIGTFRYCTSLTSVSIPDSVTRIWEQAFAGCSSLTSVYIPDSVDGIRSDAFRDCTSLTRIYVAPANPDYFSLNGVLYRVIDETQTALVACPGAKFGTFVIPGSVTKIMDSAFRGCSSLTSVTIPNGVEIIEDWTFTRCTSLRSVTIPHSVTRIGYAAFNECTSLTSVTIPDSVKVIGDAAFGNCTSLTSMTIPHSVGAIGEWAFHNCTNLESVTIPNGVTTIRKRAFTDCTSLTSVTIPHSVTTIGDWAFESCDSLTSINVDPANSDYSSLNGVLYNKTQTTLLACPGGKTGAVTIPDSVTSIEDRAFYDCNSLTSVSIPRNVTNLDYQTFDYCASLTSINVDPANSFFSSLEGVLYDETQTFLWRCPRGKSGTLAISDRVTNIIGYVFRGCANLTSINVDPANSIYSSLDGVFYNKTQTALLACPGGKTGAVTIPGSVIYIDNNAFYDCTRLTSVTIPGSVTYIGDSAFYGCTGLTNVTIPSSVTTIRAQAFSSCTSLTKVYFQGNAPDMPIYVFAYSPDTTVFHYSDATGFTEPIWNIRNMITDEIIPTVNMGVRTEAKEWLTYSGLDYDTDLTTDPLDNGQPLLVNYAFGLPSKGAQQPAMDAAAAAGQLELRFKAPRADVSYAVEASTDLVNWYTEGITVTGPDADGNMIATVYAIQGRVFLRVSVSVD